MAEQEGQTVQIPATAPITKLTHCQHAISKLDIEPLGLLKQITRTLDLAVLNSTVRRY
jgi:hypothetical protein